MNRFLKFVKSTLIGGLLFLLPFVITLVLVVKAGEIAMKAAKPIAALLPFAHAAAVTAIYLAGAVIIALACFVAGLFAQSHRAGRIAGWLEDKFLSRFPFYSVTQNISQSIAGIESDETIKPVLVGDDAGWRVGFEIEPVAGGFVAVFMPESPNPWTGTVEYVPAARIRRLDVPLPEVLKCYKRFGRGSAELLGEALARAG